MSHTDTEENVLPYALLFVRELLTWIEREANPKRPVLQRDHEDVTHVLGIEKRFFFRFSFLSLDKEKGGREEKRRKRKTRDTEFTRLVYFLESRQFDLVFRTHSYIYIYIICHIDR